jgi:hypothetical protein
MSDLTIADLKDPSRQLAEELVRVLLASDPTGEEPLADSTTSSCSRRSAALGEWRLRPRRVARAIITTHCYR